MQLILSKPNKSLKGEITLNGSKSIANRALIIRALSGEDFRINNLSSSKDTQLMEALLSSKSEFLDAGAAGTTFRFLTAFLAIQDGSRILTGSERMKQRPIGILVDALKELGASIEYLEKQGYPPLRINSPKKGHDVNTLNIPANTSSQYISALLMLAPALPKGLNLNLIGTIVSRPYIEMTLRLMAYFGIKYSWRDGLISIPPQSYQPKDFDVEADWSAASYYFAMAAFSDDCDLKLNGLFKNSSQGDAVLPLMMERFGVKTVFENKAIRLTKSGEQGNPFFEWDFLPCPDLAQTLAVTCGGLNVKGLFTGLETLRIKETDRIAALQNELAKVGVSLSKLPSRFSKNKERDYYMVEGQAEVTGTPVFLTYEDHRMAMALAPLAMFGEIAIKEPEVVEKSYPKFWEDLRALGFDIRSHWPA